MIAIVQATVPSTAYTHSQQLVTIDGGRRVNMFCLGTGSPVVVLDAGAGENTMVWRHVHEQIAAVTRTCAYDRAGYGFSDSSTRASDATNAVDDLHRLIETEHLAPIVYVGHSIAGLYGSLLTATYGSDVAGLVLIDPAFPHQNQAMAAASSSTERSRMATRSRQALEQIRGCIAHATASCTDTKGYAEPLDDTLKRELERQYARPRLMAAALSEYGSFWPTTDDLSNVDDRELDAVHIDFGDRPLVVLTRANADSAWVAGHDALAKRSTRGSHVVVPHSGHHIQFDQPGAVIDAVLRVVRALRPPGAPPHE